MYVSPSLSDESSPDAAICAKDSRSSSSSLAWKTQITHITYTVRHMHNGTVLLV